MTIKKEGYLRNADGEFAFRQFTLPQSLGDSFTQTVFNAVLGQKSTEYNRAVGEWKRGRVSRNPAIQMNGQKFPKTSANEEKLARTAYRGKKKPSLVLEFIQETPTIYSCRLGKRVSIRLVKFDGAWVATARFGKKVLHTTRGRDHKMALARLCGQRWFFYEHGAEWWSLYDLYRTVNWQGLDARNNPRPNDAISILDANHVRGVWCYLVHTKRRWQGLKRVPLVGIPKVPVEKLDIRNEMSFVAEDIADPPKPKKVTYVTDDGRETKVIAAAQTKVPKPKFVAGEKIAPAVAPATAELVPWTGVLGDNRTYDESKPIVWKEPKPKKSRKGKAKS